jgi:hypothetical protein
MSRSFSSVASRLLNFLWGNVTRQPDWEVAAETCIARNLKLPSIDTVRVKYVEDPLDENLY